MKSPVLTALMLGALGSVAMIDSDRGFHSGPVRDSPVRRMPDKYSDPGKPLRKNKAQRKARRANRK